MNDKVEFVVNVKSVEARARAQVLVHAIYYDHGANRYIEFLASEHDAPRINQYLKVTIEPHR